MPVNSFDDYPMTWKPILNRKEKPYYLTLASQLEKDIRNGIIRPGIKLPPQRELADYLDVNLSTVSKAFKICEMNGLLSARVGCGTFVQYGAISDINLLPKKDDIIEMGSNIPDLNCYEEVRPIMLKMIEDPDFINWLSYSNTSREVWQKQIASRLLKQAGVPAKDEQLLFASGGQNALAAILAALFKGNDRIIAPSFTYAGFKSTANMLGLQLIPVSTFSGRFTEEGIHNACKNYRAKALFVTPDYNNPTTYCMPDSERRMIADAARKNDILIIEDGIFSYSNPAPVTPIVAYAPERTIYIMSLSKCLFPALRIAYVAAPAKYRNAISDALYNLTLAVSPLMLELASRLIESGKIDTIREGHIQEIIRRNELVNKYFAEYACWGRSECMFRWLLLPETVNEKEFVRDVFSQKVHLLESEQFAVGTTSPMNAVRLSIGTPRNREELERGLTIIARVLSSKQSRFEEK